jgi:hypothetical protein
MSRLLSRLLVVSNRAPVELERGPHLVDADVPRPARPDRGYRRDGCLT